MSRRPLTSALLAASIAIAATARAGGVPNDKLAYLTFSGSVQIPGVTLGAGTYRFRVANPEASRNVLQVLSDDGSRVYATLHTIPGSRSWLSDTPTVTLKETAEGVPPAVESLFYDGDSMGYEFVYPKDGPITVAPVGPHTR